MGLFQRLFGGALDAIALPQLDGSQAVAISVTLLRDSIDRGYAGSDGSHRARLGTPFARGYLFGFSDACIQSFGVFDELESLAVIAMVHGTLFGQKFGSRLVHNALCDQRDAEFARGRNTGDAEYRCWLNDRSNAPRSLTEYLLKGDGASNQIAVTCDSGAHSDRPEMTIWLPRGLHLKPGKPTSH